jgi:hypothetical protein
MNFLEYIPVHPDAMKYVVALMPIIALALAVAVTALLTRPEA